MKLALDFALITAFLFNALILFLLVKKSSKGLHNYILQIIFSFTALYICFVYAVLHKIKLLFLVTFLFDEGIGTLIGPLLLLYVKSIFLPQKGLIKKNRIHFIIPIIYLFIIAIPLLISSYNKTYLFNYIETSENYTSLILFYSLIYCFASLRVLKKAKEVIKHNYSNLDGIDLNWIKRFFIGVILILSIDILATLYELNSEETPYIYLTSICVIFLVIYLGYNGVLQSKILIPTFLLEKEMSSEIENISLVVSDIKKKPIDKSSESALVELEKQLKTIMRDKKPFLDENLSLKSLAELLSISDKKLSTLLNQHLKISFYDFVNEYKVKEVIHKMNNLNYDKYTLLAIAFESGFNSKTSFNRIFKKITSFSPSGYKKQLKNKS